MKAKAIKTAKTKEKVKAFIHDHFFRDIFSVHRQARELLGFAREKLWKVV